MEYFNKEMDTIPLEDLKSLQNQRLRNVVERCYQNLSYYRELFDCNGINPKHIRTTDDLVNVPFTEKKDLRDHYPYGLLGISIERIHRFAASSGTTGVPTLTGYTDKDWNETLLDQMGRIWKSFGIGDKDLVYQCYGYGLFLGGVCMEMAAKAVGATLFPAGPGRTMAAMQWLKDMKHTVICCTPTFLAYLTSEAGKNGIDPKKDWALRTGDFGGEVAAPSFRRKLEADLSPGFVYHETYGLSELGGACVAFSCPHSVKSNQLHVLADHYFVEIINPETGERVEPGEKGELVFTTLTRESSPLIRWRTRDMSGFSSEPYGCPCGRGAHPLINYVTGRTDDVLKVRGTLVFPSQIEEILTQVHGVGEGWQIVIDQSPDALDTLLIMVEAYPDCWEKKEEKERIRAEISAHIQARLGIGALIEVKEPFSLPRFEGKAKRVLDRRKEEKLIS
ncbi:MAG: phenylacetate--CoA ligase [Deltaproteobacteria bacterium]|nr:phenylacetate--CoA ligase [Deltaproteobacteria bacterium]